MSSSKTIAKNTAFLYIRMFFTMGISLYTSRVILATLGVEDFGVYNLVAGVVVLFGFLNNAMTGATQRFINYDKATNNVEKVKRIFNISIVNHTLISFVVLVFAETIGLWFLNYKLNLPEGRLYAANVVYQMTILTTVIDIMRVPYNAMIIAYEKMSYYAFLGFFETAAKLSIVFVLMLFNSTDSLILYGVLLMLVNLVTNGIYYVYCRGNFKQETSFQYYKDYQKTKELFTFSGWMLLGQVAVVGANQGLSLILNIFFGVTVNAALGVANQVNAAINGFVSNFQTAFNPQIVQSYAVKDYERHKTLILSGSKFSFFMIALVSAPVLYFTYPILHIWLGDNIPEHAEKFLQVIILCSLIDAIAGPFWMSATAIGIIKEYNITLTAINLFTLPLAYVLLKLGYGPSFAYLGRFFIYVLLQICRYYFINKKLNFERRELIDYLLPIILVFVCLVTMIFLSNNRAIDNYLSLLLDVSVIEIILITIIITVGLNPNEKAFIRGFIKTKMKRINYENT